MKSLIFLTALTAFAAAQQTEIWNSLPAKPSVLTLQREGIAKRNPDSTATLTASSITAIPSGTAHRVRVLLTAPSTGNYTLSISGANAATLWLSSSASRFEKQPIAWLYEATTVEQWNKFPSQTSAAISLTAGQSYYLEAQVIASAANGHLALGWKKPGDTATALIPIAQLSSLPADPSTATITDC